MTHDPLCPQFDHSKFCEGCTPACGTCQCHLIAKVRSDERVKAGQRVNSLPRGANLSVAAAVAAGDVDAGVGW